jgi:hypothetical protein
MTRTLAIISLAALLPACSGKPADAADAAEPKAAMAKADGAAAQAEAPADAHAEQGDHAGCIYAEGEADAPDEKHGCPGGHGEPGAVPEGDGHFGDPFVLAEALPLAQAVAGEPADAPVQVQGEVEAVCQKKGCWMVIKDGVASARVMMQGHGFAVPMDSRGKTAVVEGTLSSREFTEAQVKHLEKDAGNDPEAVSGTRTEHVLTASAVQIKS